MSRVKQHRENTFCWADLVTIDANAAKKFYKTVFNWSAIDVPAGENQTYTMLQKDGKNVCALYAMDKERQQQSEPPFWQSYVAVKDIDAIIKKVIKLEGKIILSPFDIFDYGRMSVIQDPTGASLALWQANQHIGAELIKEQDTICWNELYTENIAIATEFYSTLFGWTAHQVTGAVGEEYTVFKSGDFAVGGMLKIESNCEAISPHWAVYFSVENCDSSLEFFQSQGATVKSEVMEYEGQERFAVVQDPQGAHFLIVESLENDVV